MIGVNGYLGFTLSYFLGELLYPIVTHISLTTKMSFSLFGGIMKDNSDCPRCNSNFENNREQDLHAREHYQPPLGT